MPLLKDKNLQGFDTPTDLPETEQQAREWQEANRAWWETHPMRYDRKQSVGYEAFTKEFYQEIDRRFFLDAEVFMPLKRIPFDALIDYQALGELDVLEIGVGNGSHAGLLAQYARSLTGIDLTGYAVKSTSERMRCFGLRGTILQMDAEHMEFGDGAFDFIWSWGVIHHSSNTRQVLSEIHRVLRPGGRAVIMVYHRNFWNWYVVNGLLHGVVQGQIFKTKSVHGTVQRWTDGALARYYTTPEWKALVSEFFRVEQVSVYGSKSEVIPLPTGRLKQGCMSIMPNSFSQFLTNRCKLGGFLVSVLVK